MRHITPAGFVFGMFGSAAVIVVAHLLRLLDVRTLAIVLVTSALASLFVIALWHGLGGSARLRPLIEWMKQPLFGRRRAALPAMRLRPAGFALPVPGVRPVGPRRGSVRDPVSAAAHAAVAARGNGSTRGGIGRSLTTADGG